MLLQHLVQCLPVGESRCLSTPGCLGDFLLHANRWKARFNSSDRVDEAGHQAATGRRVELPATGRIGMVPLLMTVPFWTWRCRGHRVGLHITQLVTSRL